MTQTPLTRPVGRPSKLTPETTARLCAALQAGHTRAIAANLAGIGESTLYNWLAAAAMSDAGPELLEFLAAVKNAEVDAEARLVGIINGAAAGGTWTAAAWILERRYPDRWAKRMKADVTVTPPPAAAPDNAERNIAEAARDAEMTMRVSELARRQVPFCEWPEDLQTHSGFAIALKS